MNLKVIYGNSNPELGEKVTQILGMDANLGKPVDKHSDGEIRTRISDNVRGCDLFIIQSTQPSGDNIMELLFMLDAARRASAGRITAVIPYYGYARQERKDKPRKPISAKAIMNCLIACGAQRIITVDLHAGAIQGFTDYPVDHLFGNQVILREVIAYLKARGVVIEKDLAMVSPDAGRMATVRALAKIVKCQRLAMIDKRKLSDEKTDVYNVVGAENVRGKIVLLLDDMVDTAGTITNAAIKLVSKEIGVKEVFAAATHPVLSGPAIRRLEESPIKKMFFGDTIPIPPRKNLKKFEIISLAPLLAKAITETHNNGSVSKLFVND
jgi:ribose-phosphate pyrophosphokinase